MKKQLLIVTAGLVAATGLLAQTPPVVEQYLKQYQQTGMIAPPRTVPGPIVMEPFRNAIVTGSPFSAKEVRKTVQTLGDGTQLENSSTTLFYRDSLGRTRTEPQNGTSIVIMDPVGGYRFVLDTATKTASRMTTPAGGVGRAGGGPTGSGRAGAAPIAELQAAMDKDLAGRQAATKLPQPNNEDLGVQSQNGVMAQGTRSTVTIPQGQIGNNRDIHVVNERWYSKDLQMMVKTVNSDPRFGVTTYELTDIVQAAPDATLFQVPPGYTVTETAGRGGRAGR